MSGDIDAPPTRDPDEHDTRPARTDHDEHRATLRGHALAAGVTAGFAWLLWMLASAMEVRIAVVAAIVTFVGAVLYGFLAMVFAARVKRAGNDPGVS